ncbi:MAG TPA: hypothetical protein VND21_05550 [Planctomycetota bacterium]|jgi:hypothetical protein|nr:hypothetical protein [Planctomycetota bacterium]
MADRRAWVAGLAALLLGLAGAAIGGGSPAWAEAPPAEPGAPADETPTQAYARLEATVKGHLKEKDEAALKADCARAKELGLSCAEVALRPKYLALLGSILQGTREEEVRKVAIQAIGETKEKSMFKYLRPYLAMPNAKEAGPLLIPAIEAAGQLAANDGALLLVGLVKDSKVMTVAQAAIKAIGGYASNARMRQKVVGDVIATVRKSRPGVGSRADTSSGEVVPTARVRTGDEEMSRWQALAPVLVETLNKMTGHNAATAEDWFDLYDRYKTQPNVLFPAVATEKEKTP